MNRIHRKVEYALMALKHMRGKAQGERTTVKEIATTYGCPHDVTARVLQALAGRGVLNSEQGLHGGYCIAKDLTRVSLGEVLETILGPIEVARCLHESESTAEPSCDLRSTCNIVSPIQTLNRRLTEFYRSLSVAELIDGQRGAARASKETSRAVAEEHA